MPITGRTRGSAPDIKHETLSIEVKHWQKFPAWLLDAMDQAVASADDEQIPTVILHEKGKAYAGSLTIIPIYGMMKLLDKIEHLEEENSDLRDIVYGVYEELK